MRRCWAASMQAAKGKRSSCRLLKIYNKILSLIIFILKKFKLNNYYYIIDTHNFIINGYIMALGPHILNKDSFISNALDSKNLHLEDTLDYTKQVISASRKLSQLTVAKQKYSLGQIQESVDAAFKKQEIPIKDNAPLVKKIQASAAALETKINEDFDAMQQEAFNLYRLAAQSSIGFKLLGNELIRENRIIQENFGTISSRKSPLSFEEIDEDSVIGGGVLNDGNWNIFKNDAVMLGTIHSCQEVYLCWSYDELCSLPDSELYDHYLRVVAREITQLVSAGYGLIDGTDAMHGIVFVPLDQDRAKSLSLSDMANAAAQVNSADKMRSILFSIPKISYDDYVKPC